MIRSIVTIIILSICLIDVAESQSAEKLSIYVSHSGNDEVGRLLAFSVRERIRASTGMKLADSPEEAPIHYHIVTLNPDRDYSSRTVYSSALTVVDFSKPDGLRLFISSWVGTCGRSMVNSCAVSAIADIDEFAVTLRKAVRDAVRKLQSSKGDVQL